MFLIPTRKNVMHQKWNLSVCCIQFAWSGCNHMEMQLVALYSKILKLFAFSCIDLYTLRVRV